MNDPAPCRGKTLLAVLAHPDDETFGVGGTLALYAGRGADVHLVCATRGEAGSMDPDCLDGFDTIADRRVHELRCASDVLGLTGLALLDYRDSGMPGSADNQHPQALINAPLDQVAAQIVAHIRSIRPQVVITFDPIGGYKHPDHIHIHRATVRAFELAGDPAFTDPEVLPPFAPSKLYYHVFPKTFFKWAVRFLRLIGRDPTHFGRNGDIDLEDLVRAGSFPVHATVDYRPVAQQREQAAACHASQLGMGTSNRGFTAWVMRLVGGRDHYMRAFPPVDGNARRERDLFEGL